MSINYKEQMTKWQQKFTFQQINHQKVLNFNNHLVYYISDLLAALQDEQG